jgi:exodeoxyribonuclease V beta subunit
MKDFDLLASPLAGTNLIEAAAGTGKTYAIAGLYVRLVVEKGLSPGQILVMTYTVAATEELKERIRNNLRDAALAFAQGTSEDSFLKGLLDRCDSEAGRMLIHNRLRDALRNFDEAAVFTIHGFCQRMLQEHAFESGSFFDAKMITDQEEIKREMIEDFWRTHLYEALPEIGGYALVNHLHPQSLSELLTDKALHEDIRIIPEVMEPPVADIKKQLAAIRVEFDHLAAVWPGAREEVRDKLKDPGIKANIYGNRVDQFITILDDYVSARQRFFLPPDELTCFTTGKLAASMKKGCSPPAHEIFPLCQSLLDKTVEMKKLLDRYLLYLKAELFRTVRLELPIRKQEKNILFYDDLLSRLKSALAGRSGPPLAEAISAKYKAAMVDEFQDTDPTQYAIIHAVFGGSDSILFLIGDPKQAIYSFRGADLFAYMKAAAHVDAKYSMSTNWRADPKLIEAVNALFSCRENPFVYGEIGFRPAGAGNIPKRISCRIGTGAEAPFHLWFLSSESTRPLGKQDARLRIAHAVAAEISRLLDLARRNMAVINNRPLQEGDIAILVRRNKEVLQMQANLRFLGIPCVVSSADNVFDSPQAEEIEWVLAAVARPGDERLMRRALATSLMGFNGPDLDRLMVDEAAWGVHLAHFKRYHDLWRGRGFMRMFRQWLTDGGVRSRLLALRNGERSLTNVLHLAEILHREALEENLGMTGLLKWLSTQRRREKADHEEHQLRLESDDNAVKIVTIHKSKGLEYPVVFCPFAWDGAQIRKTPFLFHDEKRDRMPVCDLGSENVEDHKNGAVRELLAENIRLLYVALTRAKHRCYFVWGRFNEAGTSAPFYLFHGRQQPSRDDFVLQMAGDYQSLPVDEMRRQLEAIALHSDGGIAVTEMPEGMGFPYSRAAAEKEFLVCRPFEGKIDISWKVTSFSYLISGRPQSTDLPDYDTPVADERSGLFEDAGSGPGGTITEDILDFPRGTRSGTFLHALLEGLDFAERDNEIIRRTISGKLEEHGFDPRWETAVSRMFRNVTDCPLDTDAEPLKLSAVSQTDRINELGFYFPLKSITSKGLARLFGRYGIGGDAGVDRQPLGRLHFNIISGYMRGFMDMVFLYRGRYFLVDWKSNFLGSRVSDYEQEALFKAMNDGFYFLQFHLYAVALHRYLSIRVPGYDFCRHFGGVYYLFLRGIDPAYGPAFGVYYDLPPQGRIEALCEGLIADS